MNKQQGNDPGQQSPFAILICGGKEVMHEIRRCLPPVKDVHLQYVASSRFLTGRAIFRTPGMVLLDISNDGTSPPQAILKDFSSEFPDVPIVGISKKPARGPANDLIKLGVSAFFCLPEDRRRLSDHVSQLRSERLAKQRGTEFLELQRKVYDFHHIVGNSPCLQQTIDRAHKIIASNSMTVLITGETGTGKELLARAIHYNSGTKLQPFVDIACSALPENLLESELFGHEKGSFTDAKDKKKGLFEMAGEGTIFLDEIGDISLPMQSKLMKVIEDRVMRRIGGVKDIQVRARIIAATSVDLEAKVRSGGFRRDLYHRLKILPLEVPPLRERPEDIPMLVDGFVAEFNAEYGKQIRGVAPETLRHLMEIEWEGNVRELRHAIERAVLLEDGAYITDDDFEFSKTRTGGRRSQAAVDEIAVPKRGDHPFTLVVPRDNATIANMQLLLARKVLEATRGNKLAAARILGISRPRLDRILRNADDLDD